MMTVENEARALTIRLTPERHEAAVRLAQQMNLSLNQLVQMALEEILQLDRDLALYQAATRLGEKQELERD